MIVKTKDGYVLRSKDGSRVLGGPYRTIEEAVDREKQVLLIKRLKELEQSAATVSTKPKEKEKEK